MNFHPHPASADSSVANRAATRNASDPGFDADDESFDQEAWDEWYRERIRQSLADPRPRVPHEVVMAKAWDLIRGLEARHGRQEA